ncbi:MAG: glycoside hydrolase, partial [Pseudomonadota bacterium]|nr:glycoside hydrolase [Pseudomonadota bacterium]
MPYNLFRRAITSRARPINTIKLEQAAPVHQVDERYLSFSIDISLIIGGQWWEGSDRSSRGLGTVRVPPLPL